MLNIFKWDWWRSGVLKQDVDLARTSVSDYGTTQNGNWAYDDIFPNNEDFIQEIKVKILKSFSISELTRLLCKQDPTISRVHSDFQIFTTLDYELTCENEVGQRILDDFQVALLQNRNNFSIVLAKLFSSIITQGTCCFEITIDPLLSPSNLFVINPDTLYFKTRTTPAGEVWDLGQYDNDKFIVLSPDRVFFDAINPLVGDFRGHSFIAPAFKSAVFSDVIKENVVEIIKKHVDPRRWVNYDPTELIKGKASKTIIQDTCDKVREAVNSPDFQDPTKVPVIPGPVNYGNVDDSQPQLDYIDVIDRVLDRKTIRGSGASPFNLGSNEFTAESSAKSQGLRESVRIESFQKRVEKLMGYALSLPLRYVGITEPARLFLKRIDIVERELEADVVQKMSVAVGNLVKSGIPVETAIKMFSEMTGTHISQQLIEEIEEANAEPSGSVEPD